MLRLWRGSVAQARRPWQALIRTKKNANADMIRAEASLRAKESEFKRQSKKKDEIKDQIEKCSESTGMIFVLFKIDFFLIKFHPHIIDSLFAIAIFFVNLIILIVGSSPAIPTIELIT